MQPARRNAGLVAGAVLLVEFVQPLDLQRLGKQGRQGRVKARVKIRHSGARPGVSMECLINIDVANLEVAIAFYERGVGLRLARRLFGGTVAEMLGASSPIYLLAKAAGTAASPQSLQARDYHRHWTPVHLDFVVSDLDAAVRRAMAAGAQLEGTLQSFVWGRQAIMSDPFGHGVCFVQWSGRGYAEVE